MPERYWFEKAMAGPGVAYTGPLEYVIDREHKPGHPPRRLTAADVAGRLNAIESLANELADILNAIISTGTRLTDDAFREFEDLDPETFDDPLATRAAIIDCFRTAYAKHTARRTGSGDK